MKIARGSVLDRPWGITLGSIGMRHVTGQLNLTGDDGKSYAIALIEGTVVAASSSLASDSIARIALTSHLITSSQIQEITRRLAAAPERDEIDVLAEAARLGEEHIEPLRRRVITQRAARTFSVERGEFVVDDEITLPTEPPCEVDMRAVIFLGIRMNLSEQRLNDDLREIGSSYMLRPGALDKAERYGFTDAEQPILQALAQGTSIAELEATQREIEPRAMRAMVYALCATGACDATGGKPVERSAEPPMPRTATRMGPGVAIREIQAARPADSMRDIPVVSRTATPQPTVGRTPTPQPSRPPRAGTAPGTPVNPAISRTATPREPALGRVTTPRDLPTGTPTEPAVSRTATPQPARTTQPAVSRTATPQPTVSRTATQPARPGTGQPPPTTTQPVVSRTATQPARTGTANPPPTTTQPAVARSATRAPTTEPTRSGTGSEAPSQRPATPRAATVHGTGPAVARTPTPSMPRTTTARRLAAREIENLVAPRIPMIAEGADHFAMLGLVFDAPIDAVRAAYFNLARQLHPDKLADLGAELDLAAIQRVFAQINLAFATLTDPMRRSEYLGALRRGEATPTASRARTGDVASAAAEARGDKTSSAAEAFQRGELALRRELFPDAVLELGRAVELDPSNVDYAVIYAWAKFVASTDKAGIAPETRKSLEKGILRSPKPEIARFYLGRVERMLGRDREALRHFQEVLILTPNNAEAASEVRIIQSRLAAKR